MPDNNNINIGGVRFNKNDVQKSEVIKKDGKVMNSVFLRDGTHVVFPSQAAKNESVVEMHDKTKTEKSPFGYSVADGEFGIDCGTDQTMINIGSKEVKTGNVDIDFYRMNGAKITGTDKQDDYTLKGCRNTKVDVSQNDGARDVVTIKDDDKNEHYRGIFGNREPVPSGNQHSVDGKVFVSGNNEVKQNKEDITYVRKDNPSLWNGAYDEHKGKGSVKEK